MNEKKEPSDNTIHIDVSLIPPHTKEVLAASTLEFILRIIRQPGGREALDRKKAELGLC